MRVRSVALVLSMSALLAGSILRCSAPPLPPGPEAVATPIRFIGGAVVTVPGDGTIDRPALVASLKEAKFTTIILRSSGNQGTAFVNGQVSLAVELQRELEADVYIGMYKAGAQVLAALRTANASKRIGCFVTDEPELVDFRSDQDRIKVNGALFNAAGACSADGRGVAVSPLVTSHSGDPNRAGVVLREVLRDTGVSLIMLQDGVRRLDPAQARTGFYYQGLRNAFADRAPIVHVWANVDAFDCVPPSCATTRPITTERLFKQLCSARFRVEGIVAAEYLHDLAERPLVDASTDADAEASAELQAIYDDSDASAQLRKVYLEWRDAGAPCAP